MFYNNSKVYKIVNDIDDLIYVGSTTNTLPKRWDGHKSNADNPRHSNRLICQHIKKHGVEHFRIVLVESVHCENKDELRAREEYWRKELKATLHAIRAIVTPEEVKADHKQYNIDNNERLLELKKKYREENKEKIIEGRKAFRDKNREQLNEADRLYREANKEKVSEGKKRCYEAKKEYYAQKKKEYYEANKEAILADQKEKHRLKVLAQNKPPKVMKTKEEIAEYKRQWYLANKAKQS